MNINILYHDAAMPKLEFIGGSKSDWIDVRVMSVKVNGESIDWVEKCSEVDYKYLFVDEFICYAKGDVVAVDLGVSIELPIGYEAHLLPRSSTFKNYGLMMVNSMGIIDESYKGEGDHWIMHFIAMKDGKITKYDRLGQFRILAKMSNCISPINVQEVLELKNEDRGGIGSSGNK